jgi:hypothetical protein
MLVLLPGFRVLITIVREAAESAADRRRASLGNGRRHDLAGDPAGEQVKGSG